MATKKNIQIDYKALEADRDAHIAQLKAELDEARNTARQQAKEELNTSSADLGSAIVAARKLTKASEVADLIEGIKDGSLVISKSDVVAAGEAALAPEEDAEAIDGDGDQEPAPTEEQAPADTYGDGYFHTPFPS